MDFRRTILWMIFGFSLVMLYDGYNRHLGKASMFGGPAPTQTAGTPGTPTRVADPLIPGDSPSTRPAASSTAPVPASTPAAAAASQRIGIRTDNAAIDFDTEGAQIVRLELLEHRDQNDNKANVVLLDNEPGKRVYLAQTGLAGEGVPNHRTPFVRVAGPTEMAADAATLDVAFEATTGTVKLRKIFTFTRGRYDIGVRHEIFNEGTAPISPTLYLQLTRDSSAPAGESRFMSVYTGAAFYTDAKKFNKISFSDIQKQKLDDLKGTFNDGWIAIIQHYFASAWIPSGSNPRTFEASSSGDLNAIRVREPLDAIAPGASVTVNSILYVGPEDTTTLAALAPGLELAVDYGHLTIIAKPLFWLLQWWHSVSGNWGWAVILLTITIKAFFYPLSAASYKSMAKMRGVAPRLKKLQEQYKDDRQKLNLAMMELYKTEKINPVGGCLPMVIQIPVFIALYSTVLATVEMRGAPWLGWIHDLTAPDPFFILPAIMIATMFVQYKLNPTPPDPVQAKVFMFMPLIFGGMMVFFPSALVLYWVVNNTLSIAQQWQITRKIEGKPLFGKAAT
ncbi:membrane protein insertase YidC [soil metagenome]